MSEKSTSGKLRAVEIGSSRFTLKPLFSHAGCACEAKSSMAIFAKEPSNPYRREEISPSSLQMKITPVF